MTTDQLINALATVTLLEMMVTIGLGVTFADVVRVAGDWRGVLRALLANYVLVPAAAVGLLLLVHPPTLVAVGFLIAAVCPGAPYGPPFTALAKGNVVAAVGLMVILAGSSAILAPLLLQSLLPFVAGEGTLKVNASRMVMTLIVSQFLPLCVGLSLRHWKPAQADRLRKPFARLSLLLNLLLLGFIFAVQIRMLAQIRPIGYLGMLALVMAALLAGWLAGGPTRENRKTLAMTTSVRNVGVSVVIASGSFPGTPAIAATTAYALFQTVVMALVALAWSRMACDQAAPAADKRIA